jgi:hypothetical protein
MPRLALAVAFAAMFAAGLPSPGAYLAIGLGIAALGLGRIGFRRREAPGGARLLAAGAMAIGVLGLLLGGLRVALALAAIGHIEGMLG